MARENAARRIVSLLLAVVFIVSVFPVIVAAKDDAPKSGAEYTTVFVHGLFGWGDEDGVYDILPYWGLGSGNFLQYLSEEGYDVFAASVGPLSSAHDRCCELFAQLTGSRVDYGQAHADKISGEYAVTGSALRHERYGRDYTGDAKIDSWGPVWGEDGEVLGWYDNKINLVGHSFGGPTSLEFVNLLANGDEDERAWAMEQASLYGGDWHSYISPLFWGDYNGQYLVNSVTSVAGVLNGTTFITANDGLMILAEPLMSFLASATGSTFINRIYDFQLEQFGITEIPGEDASDVVSVLTSLGFTDANDNAFYDLTTEGTNILKTGWGTFDNIYYFSYACDKTYSIGSAVLPDADMFAVFIPFSMVMGAYNNANELVNNVDGTVYSGIDSDWQKNDGMVNTISARYPLGTPHKPYNDNTIESGVWNVHKDIREDHFGVIGGLFGKSCATKQFFDSVISDIEKTVPVNSNSRVSVGVRSNRLSTPKITSSRRTLLRNVSLDWKSVGRCSYEIYRSTSSDGEYLCIDTTLLTSYTDYSARNGVTYYYKIVAVPLSGNYSSSLFSNEVVVK